MKSPTSSYNQAIIQNNLKRFGFIGILYGILTLVINIIGVLPNMIQKPYQGIADYNLSVVWPNPWDIFTVFFVPVILGVALFRYIQEERALTATHAYPVSRKSLFGSQILSFIIIYWSPIVINGLLGCVVLVSKEMPFGQAVLASFFYCGVMILSGSMVFGLSILFGMLVGSSILQAALTYLLMIVPLALVELSRVLLGWLLIGFPDTIKEGALHYLLTPYYTVGMAFFDRDHDLLKHLIILAVFLGLALVLSYWVYQKRPLEKHHDLIAFSYVKVGFVALFTMLLTLSLAGLIGSMMETLKFGIYIGLFFGALIGYAITKMIAEKTINVFVYYKEWLLVLAAFMLTVLILDLDVIGYETKIPSQDQIEKVSLDERSSYLYNRLFQEGNGYGLLSLEAPTFDDPEFIDLVITLQEDLIDWEKNHWQSNRYSDISLTYYLSNGRTLTRSYAINGNDTALKAIHESKTYRAYMAQRLTWLVYESDTPIGTIFSGGNEVTLDQEALKSFMEAYLNDLKHLSYYEEISYDSALSIELSYVSDYVDQPGGGYETRNYASIPIYATFKESRSWLINQGYDFLFPRVDQLTSGAIYGPVTAINQEVVTQEGQEAIRMDSSIPVEKIYDNSLPITDPDILKILYELEPDYSLLEKDAYRIVLQGQEPYYQYIQFRVSQIPANLLPYVTTY